MIFFTPELAYFLLMLVLVFILYLLFTKFLVDIISRHEILRTMISKMQAASHVRYTTKTLTRLTLAKDTALVSEYTDCIEIFTDIEKEPSAVGATNGSNLK